MEVGLPAATAFWFFVPPIVILAISYIVTRKRRGE